MSTNSPKIAPDPIVSSGPGDGRPGPEPVQVPTETADATHARTVTAQLAADKALSAKLAAGLGDLSASMPRDLRR